MSKKQLPEGVKQIPVEDLSKQDQEDLKKFEEEQRIKGVGDMINFKSLYKIKGIPNIWTARTGHLSKSGMVDMIEYMRPENTKRVHAKKELICLANWWFDTKEMEEITIKNVVTERIKKLHISAVFNNLNAHFIDVDVDCSKHVEELMSVMVPNYDEHEFKPYHVKKVILWYNEIKNKIIAAEKLAEIKKQEEEQNAS